MASAHKMVAVPTLTELLSDPARISVLPHEAIAELRGQIAKLDTLLLRRLVAGSEPHPGVSSDRLLAAAEAAQKLGTTKDWLYRHANTLPFAMRVGKKQLRFSEIGIERYIHQRAGR